MYRCSADHGFALAGGRPLRGPALANRYPFPADDSRGGRTWWFGIRFMNHKQDRITTIEEDPFAKIENLFQ
ncbi:hypothetical protein [Defluviimonas salinarum]|uniref:Uncharacterized protein n=1 Tax=Defluviimonas salinarum TaxID=2992147 RepID=A0ABT3JA86_9RHOB|nr:hypothetical protein [Defluviimonas salinarum]MCW3784314.1 hypothetical protein [Defluviimonas salinarum]